MREIVCVNCKNKKGNDNYTQPRPTGVEARL